VAGITDGPLPVRLARGMSARILVIDIETQRAVVETFSLFSDYTSIDRVLVPARVLCFAAKWFGEEQMFFHGSWDDDDEYSYDLMLRAAWNLYHEADFVVTWNGDRFDTQWLQAEFGRLELGPPSPFKSVDLMKVAKKNFGQGLMSKKLDWSARNWLGDRKAGHGGMDLWHEIRHGDHKSKKSAQKTMRAYNEQDVILTEKMLDRYLPWTGINVALYEDEPKGCTKCASPNLVKDGLYRTTTQTYQQYRCKQCGGWSRGPRSLGTSDLRPL